MRSTLSEAALPLYSLLLLGSHIRSTSAFAFTTPSSATAASSSTSLGVSIGLGPDQAVEEEEGEGKKELVAGVDYEIPDHEAYRTSRRSNLDEQCDQWFGALLGDETEQGVLGSLADDARKILTTPVELVNEVRYGMVLMRLLHKSMTLSESNGEQNLT